MAKVIDRNALIALVGISTTMLAGCGPSDGQWRVCTDQQGRRLPDADCASNGGGQGGGYGGGGGGGWRYVARTSAAPAVGERVTEGSTMPLEGAAYAAPKEGVARGGFGSIGEGLGGEGGHGGGE